MRVKLHEESVRLVVRDWEMPLGQVIAGKDLALCEEFDRPLVCEDLFAHLRVLIHRVCYQELQLDAALKIDGAQLIALCFCQDISLYPLEDLAGLDELSA